jgi:hypothetical protein
MLELENTSIIKIDEQPAAAAKQKTVGRGL